MPAETITLCGGEYVVSSVSSEPIPGYVALEPAESRMVVRSWVWQRDAALLDELLRALAPWRTTIPLDELEALTEIVGTRFDDHFPSMILHQRELAALARAPSSASASASADAVQLSELASRASQREDDLRNWLEIQLNDRDGRAVPRARYEVRLSNRELRQGYLDQQGFARLDGLPEENCEVSFPDYDASSWDQA